LVSFHEYFHGDTGRGLGASHQTGWTALAVRLLEQAHQPSPHGVHAHQSSDYVHGVTLFVDGGTTLYPGFETGG
jgi:hypothetical protein